MKGQFFVTVTYQATTMESANIKIDGGMVEVISGDSLSRPEPFFFWFFKIHLRVQNPM